MLDVRSRRWAMLGAFLCFAAVLVGSVRPVGAQPADTARYAMTFRNVPLSQALERFATRAQISLVYDSDLVRGKRAFCSKKNARAEAILQCLLADHKLDFVRTSSGTYVLIASARKAPRYGQLAGVVVDAETREPLPYASILLAEASTGTAADEAGLFHFSSLVAGEHRVVVTHVGYETHVETVQVRPGGRTQQRIALQGEPVSTEPLIVDGLQQRLPSGGLGHDAFAQERIAHTGSAGTPDVARAAGTLMGVSTRSPLADLHIQGGSNGEHQLQLDGVPVRNPASLGRLLSAFSPLALGRLTTHKAGFGATQGSYLSGVIEAEHDLSRRDVRLATATADPISFNGRVQSPFTLGDVEVTSMVAARVGMWGVYRDPTLEGLIDDWSSLDPVLTAAWLEPDAPLSLSGVTSSQSRPTARFSDVHAAARLELSPYRFLYVSAYRGSSTLGADLLDTDQADQATDRPSVRLVPTHDRYAWANTLGQVRYEWLSDARTIWTVRAYLSRYRATSAFQMGKVQTVLLSETNALFGQTGDGSDRPNEQNEVNEVGLETRVNYSLSARSHLDLSVGAQHFGSQFRAGNAFIPTLAHELRTMRWTATGRAETSLGLHTTIEGGTRLTYVPARRTLYAEPRAAIRYDRAESAIGGYAVRLAGGLYRQFTNQFDVSRDGATAVVPTTHVWLPVDHSLTPPRAYHLAADLLLMPGPSWQINLEGYHKWQPHLLAINYPALRRYADAPESPVPLTQSNFIAPSRGWAYGGGVRVAYKDRRLRGTLSYSLNWARRRFPGRFGRQMVPTPWNEPHRLTLGIEVPLGAGFTAETNWNGIWGRRWGFRQAYYDYLTMPLSGALLQGGTTGNVTDPESGETVELLPIRLEDGRLGAFDLNDPASHVLPPLYRLDIGLAYGKTWGDVEVAAQIRLVNVFDRSNVVDWSLRPTGEDDYVRIARTLPGRRPVVSLRIGY